MMQKKILVLIVAAAIAAPAAFADTANVTIYGLAHMAFQSVDNGSTAAAPGTSTNKVSSETSKLGLKGSEDLGNGLKAVWQIESMIAMDNAGGTFGTRNTFAGLSSDSMGTLILGRHDTPYKIATRKLDVFGDTIADNRSLMGGVSLSAAQLAVAALPAVGTLGASAASSFDGRQTDVLAYISPAMSGFTAAVAYVAGAEAANTGGQTKGSAWSLAGMYDASPFYGSLAYEAHDFGTTRTGAAAVTTGTLGPGTGAGLGDLAGKKESTWKLGASYKMGALETNLAYEKTSDSLGAANADALGHSAYYLSGKYSFGSDAVKVAYTHAGKLAGAAAGTDTTARQLSVGYDHNLSKRTTVYALYTKLSNGANAQYGLTTAGSTGGMAAKGADADPSAWSLGVKHSF